VTAAPQPGPASPAAAVASTELAERLARGRAKLLRARGAVGVVPVGQLFPVRAGPPLRPIDRRAVRQGEPGQLGQCLQQRSDVDPESHCRWPYRRTRAPVDAGGSLWRVARFPAVD